MRTYSPTTEQFDAALLNILQTITAAELLAIPGIYEILSEEYNNAAIEDCQQHAPLITISDMLNSREYQAWEADALGNDLFIHDPDRAARIYDAAENGTDGSTHQERIDDWREFINLADYPEHVAADLLEQCDRTEEWHDKNGSLNQQGS